MTTPASIPDSQPAPPRVRHVIGDATLGWAIFGASNAARHHVIPAIRSQPPLPESDVSYPVTNSRVVGVFSHDEARARQFADEMQIPLVFVNFADVLDRQDVDCVYVGGHPRHHARATLAALAAGKHVLCETPLALSLEDATAMTHTAASTGRHLAVNHFRRADPAISAMRQLLIQREIGDILGARSANMILLRPSLHTWRLLPNGGGVIFDRTIHDIDLIRYLLRDEVASVYARSSLQILSNVVDEDVVVHLEMRRTGRIMELRDSFLIPHNITGLDVYGSAGTLSARNCFTDDAESELLLLKHGRGTRLPIDHLHPCSESIARFHAAVRGEGQPLASGSDGLQNLAAALAVHESMRTSLPVALSPAPHALDDRSVV